jgi:hypothetical protein
MTVDGGVANRMAKVPLLLPTGIDMSVDGSIATPIATVFGLIPMEARTLVNLMCGRNTATSSLMRNSFWRDPGAQGWERCDSPGPCVLC